LGTFSDRKEKQNKTKVAKKVAGGVLIGFGALCLVFCCIPNFVVAKALLGILGILAYPTFLLITLLGVALCMNLTYKKSTKQTILVALSCFALFCFLHSVFSAKALGEQTFGEYLAYCYNMQKGITVGGVIIGFFANVISVQFCFVFWLVLL